MNVYLPLISCICVTRCKPDLLQRAIDCFSAQTYPNKELIIVYESDDQATEAFIGNALPRDSRINAFRVSACPKTSLGELRNHAVGVSAGEFICQWDDDDWSHMDRLKQQYGALLEAGRDGCIMTQWIVYDSVTATAYISNVRLWEGSILCLKSALQLKPYENRVIGEDTATIDWLASSGRLRELNEMPGLYIYVYHGKNTWDYEHWRDIFRSSTPLSAENSRLVSELLRGRYSISQGSRMLDRVLKIPA